MLPLDIACSLEGVALEIHPANFEIQNPCLNVNYPIYLSEDGGVATVEYPAASGKFYSGRFIVNYPKSISDILLYDAKGSLCKVLVGIPVSRLPVVDVHVSLNRISKAISLIELKTVQAFAEHTLSVPERKRYIQMGERRKASYIAARLACKRLSRKLSGNDWMTSPCAITTSSIDHIRPRCPLTDGTNPYYCSVSHDKRFAVAVASEEPIGIDVEEISERVLPCQKYFMSPREQDIAENFTWGQMDACIRIWTIKEAVSKALDIMLPECWKRVNVQQIGTEESMIECDGRELKAFHDKVDNHLFTVVIMSTALTH